MRIEEDIFWIWIGFCNPRVATSAIGLRVGSRESRAVTIPLRGSMTTVRKNVFAFRGLFAVFRFLIAN